MQIDDWLKSGVEIERAVDAAIYEELHVSNLDGLQLINREVIIKYVRLLLEVDRKLTPFTIIGLEKRVDMPYGDTIIGGYIDRLDMVTDPETGEDRIRVIDYKPEPVSTRIWQMWMPSSIQPTFPITATTICRLSSIVTLYVRRRHSLYRPVCCSFSMQEAKTMTRRSNWGVNL